MRARRRTSNESGRHAPADRQRQPPRAVAAAADAAAGTAPSCPRRSLAARPIGQRDRAAGSPARRASMLVTAAPSAMRAVMSPARCRKRRPPRSSNRRQRSGTSSQGTMNVLRGDRPIVTSPDGRAGVPRRCGGRARCRREAGGAGGAGDGSGSMGGRSRRAHARRFCTRWAAPIAADSRDRRPSTRGRAAPARGQPAPSGGAARAATRGALTIRHIFRGRHTLPRVQVRVAAPVDVSPRPLASRCHMTPPRNRPQSTPTTGHARNQDGTRTPTSVAPRAAAPGGALARAPGENRAAARRWPTTRGPRSIRDTRCRSPSARRGLPSLRSPGSSGRSGAPSRGRPSTGSGIH